MTRARRFPLFVHATLLALCLFPVAMPALAAVCCSCRSPNQDTKICLTADTGTCGTIITEANNPSITSVTCKPTPLSPTECTAVETGKYEQVCDLGPTPAKIYVPGSETPTASVALEVPKLNVQIPGLAFKNFSVVQNENIEIPLLAQYIAAAFRYLLTISVVAAAVMVVYGGFKYILSSSLTGVKSGKEIIKDAILGLLLVVGAYTILATVNPNTLALNAIKFAAIKKVEAPSLKEYNESALALGKTPALTTGQALKDVTLPSGPAPTAAGAGGSSGEPSKGCTGGLTTEIKFPYAPAGNAGLSWRPDLARIIVPGKALKCPGKYPALIWFHGNGGWGPVLNDFKAILDDKVNSGAAEPLIVIFPASNGKSDKMFPGGNLADIRDAALKTLKANPDTKDIEFSSVSVGAHSGSGCNPIWSTVNTISPYAVLNADTCFGLQEETHNPEKMVVIVSTMASLSGVVVYPKLAGYFKLQQMNSCPQLPFEITDDPKLVMQLGVKMSCMKNPDKDWYLFYALDKGKLDFENHLSAPKKALLFALDHFFHAK